LEGNKALYKPCSKFDGKFEEKRAVFLCNRGDGHPGQFVYVRDDREEQEYFGLCEVEVFRREGESAKGKNFRHSQGSQNGEGERVFCLQSEYSFLSSSLLPDVRACGEPEQPVSSRVNRTRGPDGADRAEYSCLKGYRSEGGQTVRECRSDTGAWGGSAPKCRRKRWPDVLGSHSRRF